MASNSILPATPRQLHRVRLSIHCYPENKAASHCVNCQGAYPVVGGSCQQRTWLKPAAFFLFWRHRKRTVSRQRRTHPGCGTLLPGTPLTNEGRQKTLFAIVERPGQDNGKSRWGCSRRRGAGRLPDMNNVCGFFIYRSKAPGGSMMLSSQSGGITKCSTTSLR